MKAGGGLITKDDLAAYKANERKPIHTTYRGLRRLRPAAAEFRRRVPRGDAQHPGELTTSRNAAGGRRRRSHLMIEAMRRGYADRARHLGDPDFAQIPDHLTTQGLREEARRRDRPRRRRPRAPQLAPEIALDNESEQHHALLGDRQGRHGREQHVHAGEQLRQPRRRSRRGLHPQQRDDRLQPAARRHDARRDRSARSRT